MPWLDALEEADRNAGQHLPDAAGYFLLGLWIVVAAVAAVKGDVWPLCATFTLAGLGVALRALYAWLGID